MGQDHLQPMLFGEKHSPVDEARVDWSGSAFQGGLENE